MDVLHCYVDDCNVVGALAGALAGTTAVVLSFRNGNPTNFPGLLRPWTGGLSVTPGSPRVSVPAPGGVRAGF